MVGYFWKRMNEMKFSYDGADEEKRAVAYIDSAGDLIIRRREDENAGPIFRSVALLSNEKMTPATVWSDWDPKRTDNKAVFYPGDTITITF